MSHCACGYASEIHFSCYRNCMKIVNNWIAPEKNWQMNSYICSYICSYKLINLQLVDLLYNYYYCAIMYTTIKYIVDELTVLSEVLTSSWQI